MSRLIDADALIETMESNVTTMSVCLTTIEARAKGEMNRMCIADVANASTIDAIPVEWLRDMMLEREAEESRAAWVVMREWRKWKREQEAQDG